MTQEALAKKLCERDEKTYIRMMDAYSRLLWKIADGVLGSVCGPEDIEECISDVFFKLWRNPEGFDFHRGNLKNYLVAMTRNQAIDLYRKQVRRQTYALEEEVTDRDDGPQERVVRREEREELGRALEALSPEDREIIGRRYFQEEKPAQISRAMEIPVRKVENRLYRAKQRLKKTLGARNEPF